MHSEASTPPLRYESFLSDIEVRWLIGMYEWMPKVHKNTGPICTDLTPHLGTGTGLMHNIFERIKSKIGPCEVIHAMHFMTSTPHIIHTDGHKSMPKVYKAITLPLQTIGEKTEDPKLIFFDQHYKGPPSKFFNGEKEVETYYNDCLYQYDKVEGINRSKMVSFRDHNEYMPHIKHKWLEGLSVHSMHEWVPGDAIMFDCTQLHCASDFRKVGVTSKLGISIFTKH
jgi:hypothetical protein